MSYGKKRILGKRRKPPSKRRTKTVIKGCQKKIIHITDTGSPFFEEAYFVLKRGKDTSDGVKDDDMVKEAMRIAGETAKGASPAARRRRRRRGSMLLLGASLCSLLFGIAMLIFVLGTMYA